MRKPKVPIIMLIIGIIITINANASSIKGYVYDKKTNEPIIGAIVTVMGQNIGTQTDFDGRFVIKDVESGTDKLVVKSIGYKDHTRTITISDKDDIDLGKIYLKTSRSKHYHRIMLSFNPTFAPILCPLPYHSAHFWPNEGETDFESANGIAFSYLFGYRVLEHFPIEIGAKYNFAWNSYSGEHKDNKYCGTAHTEFDFHSKAIHHSLKAFINLAYEKSFKDFTVSPYIGIYLIKFIYSETSAGTNGGKNHNGGCNIYDTQSCFGHDDGLGNLGLHIGLGLKYNHIYIGGEYGQDFYRGVWDPSQGHFGLKNFSDQDNLVRFNWSVSIGYEF